jgi:hypothetical protein
MGIIKNALKHFHRMESDDELLRRYERHLVEKYRFALPEIIDHMCCFVNIFRYAQDGLEILEPLAAKKLPQMKPFLQEVRDTLSRITQATPLFLGYNQLHAYSKVLHTNMKSFDPRFQPWNALRRHDIEYQGNMKYFHADRNITGYYHLHSLNRAICSQGRCLYGSCLRSRNSSALFSSRHGHIGASVENHDTKARGMKQLSLFLTFLCRVNTKIRQRTGRKIHLFVGIIIFLAESGGVASPRLASNAKSSCEIQKTQNRPEYVVSKELTKV